MAYCQNVAAQTPAYAPRNGFELQRRAFPLVAAGIRRPNPHRLVLRGGGDVRFEENGGRPGNVANPVRVPTERIRDSVCLLFRTTMTALA